MLSKSEKANGWKAYAGYQFNSYVGLELGYTDFARISASGAVGTLPFSGSQKIKGPTLSLTGAMPMTDKFAFTGKVGVIHEKSRTLRTVGATTTPLNDNQPRSIIGIGLKYSVLPRLTLRAEIERYGFGHGDNGNFYSAGAQLNF